MFKNVEGDIILRVRYFLTSMEQAYWRNHLKKTCQQ